MQRHKELYKEQSLVLSPRNHCQENRDRLQAARAKKREDCFHQNRIISVSPTPVKMKPSPAAQEIEPQENIAPGQQGLEQPPPNKEKVPLAQSNPKSTRKEAYLKRYMGWKAAKNNDDKQREQLRRGAAINAPLANQSKAFPNSKLFRAPENLGTTKQMEDAPVFQPNKRSSLYIIANLCKGKSKSSGTTKPATYNPPVNKQAHAAPMANKSRPAAPSFHKPAAAAPPTTKHAATTPVLNPVPTAPLTTNPVALARHKAATPATKPVSVTSLTTNPVALARQKAAMRPLPNASSNSRTQTTSLKPRLNTAPANEVKKVTMISRSTPASLNKVNTATVRLHQTGNSLRPRFSTAPRAPFEKPAVSRAPMIRPANVVKPQPIRGGGGAAAKFKAPAGMANKAVSHTLRMKANKPKSQYTKLQENTRKNPQLKAELLQAATLQIPPLTPLDEDHDENPFLAQATSTQCKSGNGSSSLLDAFDDSMSPVAPTKTEGDSTVKRQLLPTVKPEVTMPVAKKKFDFTRYSVANSPAEDSLILDPKQATVTGEDAGDSTLVPAVEKTPPRRVSDGKPNYLSPFVSVSRGKVNSRCEKEKRNSFYLPDVESPLEVRRAIESVLYFRLQLENEITRLQGLCIEWETYSKENETRLQETGGIDMINVTIGQTRLLTTKKMMQFRGLIDRCEDGAIGKNRQPNDGSEDTKPVQAEDLEGWWDMLRLQSENVDKRFENLKRWRANDWLDPDARAVEINQPKPLLKPKVSRTMKIKSKAKPSSNLQQFLRKAHANMKKTKVEEPTMDDADPSTSSRHSSPRLIVVRNRRSFSPARTVLRMSTGEGRPSIAPNALLKSALLAAAEQNAARTPPQKPRTSILKTPGTTKRQNRGVLFSAKKSVRRFQFTFEEGNISNDDIVGADKLEDCEEDMSLEASTERRSLEQNPGTAQPDGTPRTYTLRNRRVNLRPSHEFM
uniref:Guanylate kinase-associated protein mars isoform X1 n=1 Tax=Drosophila rhopaloa TaxID=1041015 RepID=A0A6P4FND8_DRORH